MSRSPLKAKARVYPQLPSWPIEAWLLLLPTYPLTLSATERLPSDIHGLPFTHERGGCFGRIGSGRTERMTS